MQRSTHIFSIFFLVVGLLSLTACNTEKPAKKQGLVLVNVLDKELFDDCHIAGSLNVSLETIDSCVDTIDPEAEVVVYCSNYWCSTSDYAAKKLLDLGFKQVYVYHGGTAEWYQQGLPVDGECKCSYLNKVISKPKGQKESPYMNLSLDELKDKMGLS